MKSEFINWFIKEEKYLQNYPLETNEFVRLCQRMGVFVSAVDLEEYEKSKLIYPILRFNRPIYEEEGVEFRRKGQVLRAHADYVINADEEFIRKYKEKKYSSYSFGEHEWLVKWVDAGLLYDPSKRRFIPWVNFKAKRLSYDNQKILSFYSNFQLLWIDLIKEKRAFFKTIYKEKANEHLLGEIRKYDKYLEFLLSIQSVYYPYAHSDSRTISITGIDEKKWLLKKKAFNYKRILQLSNMREKDVLELYRLLSEKALSILGVHTSDWVYLWKSISWNRKDELKGQIRKGIEYFQWAVMIKRVIEEYYKKEIPDLEEIKTIYGSNILKYIKHDFNKVKSYHLQKKSRYFDDKNNIDYYHDKYKRLFYLSNDFKLDYQPKVLVFVEGGTEEYIFARIFKWYYGSPEHLGINFINFKGVDKLLSTAKNMERLRKFIIGLQKKLRSRVLSDDERRELKQLIRKFRNLDIVVSNWTSFLSYNLEKWQIIPFFVSDNEGGIKHFLEAEKPIRFANVVYNIPLKWKFLWGIDNDNKPFKGSSLELANFSDEELSKSIGAILHKTIDKSLIERIREKDTGINKIDPEVKINKMKIVKLLFDNLFIEFKGRETELLRRPIFNVVERITNLSVLNHLPVDTKIELENKEFIKKELNC